MSKQSWEELLLAPVIDATAISNSTTETIMVPDSSIPAGYFYAGRTLRATMFGKMSNVVTTPGTLTLRARWGGVSGTVLAASAALALNTTAQTNSSIWLQWLITCRVEQNPGTLLASGVAALGLSRATQGLFDMIPASAPAAVGSLDLSATTALSFTAQFSVNTNPTNLQIMDFKLESMN
jgi:hypothetical protein